MTMPPGGRGNRAEELRAAFDQAFALAPVKADDDIEQLLAVRIGGDRFAMRLREVAGVFVDRRITRVRATVPGLIGLAGIRGVALPVYDLGHLLGYPAAEAMPRWIVTLASEPLALTIEEFEGAVHVRRDAIVSTAASDSGTPHVRDVVRGAGLARPVIALTSVLESIRSQVATRLAME